jgi:hypothetical protein
MSSAWRTYPVWMGQTLDLMGFKEWPQLTKQSFELWDGQARHTTKHAGMLSQILETHEHGWLSLRYWFTYASSLPAFPPFANHEI